MQISTQTQTILRLCKIWGFHSGMKSAVFWDAALCRSHVNRRFGGTHPLHLQGRKIRERGISVSKWLQTAPHPRRRRSSYPEILHSFPQSFQANSRIMHLPSTSLPNHYGINHLSFELHTLRHWQFRETIIKSWWCGQRWSLKRQSLSTSWQVWQPEKIPLTSAVVKASGPVS
jgi:hypothetical protein